MKTMSIAVSVIAIGAGLAGTVQICASGAAQAQDRNSFSQTEAMARINRLSKPVEDHRYLQPLVGEWRGTGMARILPELKFEPVSCRLKIRWILEERFLEQKLKCVGDGYTLEDRGFLGFDRIAGRYTGAWIDKADTGYTAIQGKRTDAVTFVLTLRHNNALTMKKEHSTNTITISNPRRHSQVSTVKNEKTGKPVVMAKIVYTR